ncbi:unnamed protein product [Closterium sp. NIES-53]
MRPCSGSEDVTFDESVPFNRLFPYRSAPPPPAPLFLAPRPPPVEPLPPQGHAPSDVSQVDPLPGTAPVEGAESGGAEPEGAASSGGPAGASPRLSPQQVREWLVQRACLRGGATGAGGAGAAGAEGDGVTARASGTRGTAATSPGGALNRGTGAAGTGGAGGAGAGDPTEPGSAGAGSSRAGGAGAGGTGAGGTSAGGGGAGGAGVGGTGGGGARAGGTNAGGTGVGGTGAGGAGAGGAGACDPGGTVRPRLYFVPLLQQVLGVPSSTSLAPPLLCPPPDQSQLPLQAASPLPAPSPYSEQSGGLTERREPASRPVSPVCTARRISHSRPPPVPGTYAMALRPSSVQLRVPLPAPLESSLPAVPDPESDRARSTSPIVSPNSASASPPSIKGENALRTDVLEDRQEDFECLAATRDYELHSLDFSTAFLQGSLHEEIWLRRPPGFTGSFPAGTQWSLQRPVYGLRQAPREWHDTLRTTLVALGFSPATTDPSLFLRTDTSIPLFYVLVYVLQRFNFQFSSPQPTPLSTGHSLSAPPSDESYVGHGARAWRTGPVVLTGHADASWIYAGAMAAQELRWLTYLLTDLGEQPRSPPVLYVDNKAMIALCKEHILEHLTKHIALRYFLAQELQQRGQLRLAYVATKANTADIFTKALPHGDHQRFSTVLGLVPTLPHLLSA